jgi:hypothetical protein
MSMNHYARDTYGPEGYSIPEELKNRGLQLDTTDPRHMWVSTVVFGVSQAGAERVADAAAAGRPPEELSLDHENLLTVQGPTCLKCGTDLTPDNARETCPRVLSDGPGDLPQWLRRQP